MRHFVYFSSTAPTSGNFDTSNLMKAGRLDIALHSIIQGLFLSNSFREDVIFHLVFYGLPDPPKHIEIQIKEGLDISKKNLAKLIQKILYKYKEGEKKEVFPGCFVEKKSLLKLVDELEEENEIFILNSKGDNLRDIEIPKNCVFLIGDHKGMPKKELRRLKKEHELVSVGSKTYFASQVVVILNHELDMRFS